VVWGGAAVMIVISQGFGGGGLDVTKSGGDGVIDGGDGRVVWMGWCVVPIFVIYFWRLQVWRHLLLSWLILFQRTPESFVVIRIVVVEVLRASGCGVSDFACLVADAPPPKVTVCSLLLLFRCCILFAWWCCGGGGGVVTVEVVWGFCVRDWGFFRLGFGVGTVCERELY